ncbi:dihydrolipoamide acetyltransferase family protein [Humibacter ginsenosidimutans]|uniref:Dihydrolipoamide acetyltransferase component of pyruvate dehydrogenase complex n=1 Tax=Humibacter ginsenosidimutans TaxID=2599293 RepID=A0A5B8M508_9MICO|nr:dihydrolipoamide acetyltransferase family protein [Humibacter ginsenosidimutans]QDZ14905.1 2-oxo acid dehydrogenase subunit E2 [Humibacter ginsenosidimutans]
MGDERARFLLPDLGEGLTEATIVGWLVSPGDVVAVDQPVVEVESAKSIVQLPSPYAGRVQSLDAAVADVVQKDAPLLTIDTAAADVGTTVPTGDVSAVGATTEGADVVPGTALRADGEASGAVLVGYGLTASTRTFLTPPAGRFGRGRRHTGVTTRSPVVSPIVRKLAHDHGFDAAELRGSGRGSLVVRDDVEAEIAARSARDAASSTAGAEAPRGAARRTSGADAAASDVHIPIVGVRKAVADHLTQSRRTVPDATIWMDVDATELVRAKRRLEATTGERYSVTALVARFVVAGLERFPVLNSSVDETAGEIVQHASINLGLAAQTGRGLMVPVVHDAQALSLARLRDAVADLVSHAERADYPPSALAGGTFTLNNYGALGVDGSSPIINSPEVAMLGLGRLMERPWVVDGELAVRTVATLSLVFDHRVCDGDVASGFLTFVARCVQEPLIAFV